MRRSRSLPLVDAPALARDAPIKPQLGRDELTITFGFHCNLACTFCLVEDALNVYGGVDLATTEALLRDARVTDGVKTILLSGGEVTIENDLVRYVELARRVPGLEHVRLQTNAVRLADRAYLSRLRDAGVDQFFVSFHGATPAVCDAITQRPGSYHAIVDGMHAIAESGGELMTNTVIVEANYRELAGIADIVVPLRPTRVDFWNYLPRVDRVDVRGQLARVGDIRPHLLAALDRCAGVPRVTVKHFPRCLLGEHASKQDDSQPTSLVDDAFWGPYPPYTCIYEGTCAHAGNEGCRGLSFAYVKRFGWEEELLVPSAREDRSRRGDYWSWSRTEPDAGVSLDVLGLEGELVGWSVAGTEAREDAVRIAYSRGNDGVSVELRPRDPTAPCFARSRSMDITHARVSPELEPSIRPLLAAIVARIEEHDRGDGWDRLVGRRSAELGAWLDALPRRETPDAERFCRAVLRVATPELVEASIALGQPAFRMHVNAAGARRSATTLELAEAAGLPDVRMLVERWLASEDREAFVGIAVEEASTRAKLYLRLRRGQPGQIEAAAAVLGGRASPDAHMICGDYAAGALIALKSYSRIAAPDAPLAEVAGARGKAWYACRRAGSGGEVLDDSVHVEVEGFGLDEAARFASASGDPGAAAWLRTAKATRVRALSEGRRRHVYVSFAGSALR